MLFSSSKRALSSTSTSTSLPFSAASIRAATTFALPGHPVQGHLDGDHLRRPRPLPAAWTGRASCCQRDRPGACPFAGSAAGWAPRRQNCGGALGEALGIKQLRALAQHVLDLKQKAQVQGRRCSGTPRPGCHIRIACTVSSTISPSSARDSSRRTGARRRRRLIRSAMNSR